ASHRRTEGEGPRGPCRGQGRSVSAGGFSTSFLALNPIQDELQAAAPEWVVYWDLLQAVNRVHRVIHADADSLTIGDRLGVEGQPSLGLGILGLLRLLRLLWLLLPCRWLRSPFAVGSRFDVRNLRTCLQLGADTSNSLVAHVDGG